MWLRNARAGREATWFILDGPSQRSTGCGASDIAGARTALARYITDRYTTDLTRAGPRDLASILIDDVFARYVRDVVPNHARPHETARRIRTLRKFWGGLTLDKINGSMCREYVSKRGKMTAARRELEDLRAAITHHMREGLHDKIVTVVMPPLSLGRQKWITRTEAARLIRAAWRYRDERTGRRTRQHIARFILVALYTGSRAGVVCSATFEPEPGHARIDLDRGVLYRRPEGERETKKRRPPVRLPPGLLAHMRRWRAHGQRYAVQWNSEPIRTRINKGFNAVAADAGLKGVTPHVLRHTAATWLMQSGADLWESAGYLGMTTATLERVYAHHHPNFQKNAHAAFGAHRK